MTEPDEGMAASVASALRPLGGVSTKKRGRKPAEFWVSFTTLEEPYKSRAAPCRHCSATVSYHKKWEQAKSHLLKCEPFLKLMRDTDAHARPEWFEVEVEKRRRSAVRLLPIDLVVHGVDVSGSGAAPSPRPSTRKPPSRSKKRDSLGSVDGVTPSELLLLQAVRNGWTIDQELLNHVATREPDGARSMQDLVDKVYQRVRRCVSDALCAQSGAMATLVVQWQETTKSVEFSVAKDDKCFFLERVGIPDTACDRGNAAAAWLMEEIRRVLCPTEPQVQYCVVHAPSEFVDTIADLSNQEAGVLSTLQIRHSPLRAFVKMVDELLQCFVNSEDDCNPLNGLLEVVLTCHDALDLLDARTLAPAYLSRGLDTTRYAVEGVRSISLADALWVIVDAGKLLDFEAVDAAVERARLDSGTAETLRSVVEDADFATKLRRFHSVLQPLQFVLTLSEKRVVHPSDMFVAFASIERSYAVNEHISEEQRHFLTEKIAEYEATVVLEEYPLAHLLDPAYLGELLGDAAKAKAEHKLMAMAREDDVGDKQALYVEYTQFQVAAVQQQTAGDGFILRMLKERKKTMLQYWLTDGRRWPRLQTIALGLEQAPVDAVSPWPAEIKRVSPTDSSIDEKMVYLQRNAPLLAVSDLMGVKAVTHENQHNGDGPMLANHVVI